MKGTRSLADKVFETAHRATRGGAERQRGYANLDTLARLVGALAALMGATTVLIGAATALL